MKQKGFLLKMMLSVITSTVLIFVFLGIFIFTLAITENLTTTSNYAVIPWIIMICIAGVNIGWRINK